MKVLHVITGLGTGGAENMLVKLIAQMEDPRANAVVISLDNVQKAGVGDKLEQLGVRVHSLGARSPIQLALGILRVAKIVRSERPAVLQAWMYHANVFSTIAVMVFRLAVPVIWNVRASLGAAGEEKRGTMAIIRIGAYLSQKARAIIYNSDIAAQQHSEIGYDPERQVVIPNGFMVDVYSPDCSARTQLRTEWQLDINAIVVGHVARYHPMKDHSTFIRSFAQAAAKNIRLRAVLAGKDVNSTNKELSNQIASFGLQAKVTLLGERNDIPKLMSAFDIFVSSSARQEGFSNVIGEAMSCGVIPIATEIGSAKWIIGSTGIVVPPSNEDALANAIVTVSRWTNEDRTETGSRARARILEHFSIDAIARQYERLYIILLQQ